MREVLSSRWSQQKSWPSYGAEGLEWPVYIGRGAGLSIHQAPVQIEGTNSHWL